MLSCLYAREEGYLSSVEVAFRIAYIFQVPAELLFRCTARKEHQSLILLPAVSHVTSTQDATA